MRRAGEAGPIIFLLVIVLAMCGGGFWYLEQSRKGSEAEAYQFGAKIVERLAVRHDLKYLHSVVPEEHRIEFTPAKEENFIAMFKMLGVPQPGWKVEGKVKFDHHYFSPVGFLKCILSYPDRHATVSMTVSCPRGPWQLDALAITYERPPQ